MAERIPKAIEQLQLDHRNMNRLLSLLRAELDTSRGGRSWDFDLLRSVMEYALHFPDLCHHPKEDRIYRRMLERDPAAAGRVGDLMRDHAHLGELTRKLAATLRNLEHDVEMPRQWLENLVESYITANRRHIAAEEQTFFPQAIVTLTDADWREIDVGSSGDPDPLFGERVAGEFRGLYDRIMRMAV